MCLVFEYMGHRNLKEYLRENRHVKRCELVRFILIPTIRCANAQG